jgi:small-conductance mechanosensitive channel
VLEEVPAEVWIGTVAIVAVAAALAAHAFAYAVLRRVAARTSGHFDDALVRRTPRPVALLLITAALSLLVPLLEESGRDGATLRHLLLVVAVLGMGWLAIAVLRAAADMVDERFPVDGARDDTAWAVRTQVRILERLGVLAIAIVAVGLALLTIPGVQPLAASLLASAGILGVVVGIAAGPVIGNLLAGIQIAFAQPIRLEDQVVIDGETGRVEAIASTHVVVRLWDQRRLIVPLSRIVNAPFENWTLSSPEILGTVTVHADYQAPVEDIRAELKRILDATELWDGRTWALQVTDATERTIVLRALVSAADPGTAWELRCLVREKLIAYVQGTHPAALPVARERHEGPAS